MKRGFRITTTIMLNRKFKYIFLDDNCADTVKLKIVWAFQTHLQVQYQQLLNDLMDPLFLNTIHQAFCFLSHMSWNLIFFARHE